MQVTHPISPPTETGPAWDIARLFPNQGAWSEADYFELDTNHLVEFADGCIEVLPMPTTSHQQVVAYLFTELHAFVTASKAGLVLFAPLPVRLRPSLIREPDVLFMSPQHRERIREQAWERADLVMEVVSPSNPEHDLVRKRAEYAQAGIPEYWIVDPRDETILVLTLRQGQYEEHGRYTVGQRTSSPLLPGFEVEVEAVFAAARDPA